MGKSNPHASNAVNPMFDGSHKSNHAPNALDSLRGDTVGRVQTVLTPAAILDPVRELFGGEIGFDPCHFGESLVRPRAFCLVPWDQVWSTARAWCLTYASEATLGDRNYARTIYLLLRSEIRAKDVPKKHRAKASKAAREVREHLRREFAHVSGSNVPWIPRTFCNPPFGDRGPETVLATFKDFCAAFARATNETVFLCPVRCQRKWWRRDILGTADAITYLNPVKFEGFDQAFPAPLCLAYKSGFPRIYDDDDQREYNERLADVAAVFAHLGDTYETHPL